MPSHWKWNARSVLVLQSLRFALSIGKSIMDSSKIHGLCYNCNTDLFGTVIEVSGKYYHNKCFYCCKCRQQLRQEEFRVRDVRNERISSHGIRSVSSASAATVRRLRESVRSATSISRTTNSLRLWDRCTTWYPLLLFLLDCRVTLCASSARTTSPRRSSFARRFITRESRRPVPSAFPATSRWSRWFAKIALIPWARWYVERYIFLML